MADIEFINDNFWTRLIVESAMFQQMKDDVTVTISRQEYEDFCKEYIFNKLKGEKFGESFCKRFGINDSTISILQDETFTKDMIESLGYIK